MMSENSESSSSSAAAKTSPATIVKVLGADSHLKPSAPPALRSPRDSVLQQKLDALKEQRASMARQMEFANLPPEELDEPMVMLPQSRLQTLYMNEILLYSFVGAVGVYAGYKLGQWILPKLRGASSSTFGAVVKESAVKAPPPSPTSAFMFPSEAL